MTTLITTLKDSLKDYSDEVHKGWKITVNDHTENHTVCPPVWFSAWFSVMKCTKGERLQWMTTLRTTLEDTDYSDEIQWKITVNDHTKNHTLTLKDYSDDKECSEKLQWKITVMK
jgi:hypothetical protein